MCVLATRRLALPDIMTIVSSALIVHDALLRSSTSKLSLFSGTPFASTYDVFYDRIYVYPI